MQQFDKIQVQGSQFQVQANKVRESSSKGSTSAKWVAAATLAAYAAVGASDALAQRMIAEAVKEPAPAQMPVRRFRIAQEHLDAALETYKAQSGISVRLEIPTDKLAGFQASAVEGLYANDAALRMLLEGTGLSYRFEGQDVAVVGLRRNDSVDVTSGLPDTVNRCSTHRRPSWQFPRSF
jgi:catecholate siderophore receptor